MKSISSQTLVLIGIGLGFSLYLYMSLEDGDELGRTCLILCLCLAVTMPFFILNFKTDFDKVSCCPSCALVFILY
jgi:Ca2+/Na+ antiporter